MFTTLKQFPSCITFKPSPKTMFILHIEHIVVLAAFCSDRNLHFFIYLYLVTDPGFDPGTIKSIAESLTSPPFELRDVVYHWIYILDLFTSVLIERIYLPGVVLNRGLHHRESADLSTAPQRLEDNVYLWIYILYFCSCLALGRRNLAPLQVRIPLSPLL